MIQLHSHPHAVFGRRVHMALLEKGIPFEFVALDLLAGVHKSPEYLAMNPYGRVPILVDDGFVLYESTAILAYLEETHPRPALVPTDARGRALVHMHMKLADLEIGTQAGALIFPKRFVPKEQWDLAAMAKASEVVQRHLGILEGQLGDRTWLVGDSYTLADVCYTSFAQFFGIMDVEVPPKVAAWAERLLARPSALKTKPDV